MTVIVEEYAGEGAVLITEVAPDGTGAVFAEILHDDDATQVVEVIHNDTVVVFAKVFKDGIEVGRVGKINFTGSVDATMLPDGTMNIDVTSGGAGSGGLQDDGVGVPVRSKTNFVGPRVRLEDDLLGSTTDVIIEAEAEGAVAAHELAGDPHPQYETSAEAAAKIATHTAAPDPHGDRAHTAAQIAAHEAAGDPHPVYETSVEAAAKITAHSAAVDPHGDRAWASAEFVEEAMRNLANGFAGLDVTAKVSLANLPTGAGALLVLDGGGLVPTSALPPLSINEVWPVANQAARLALTAQRGDMAVQADNGKTYVLSTDDPSVNGNWVEVLAAGQVTQVNGQSGVVSLAVADIVGLTAALAGKEATGTAAAAVAAHAGAADPHGDRAYAAAQDAAHVGATANVHAIPRYETYGGITTAAVQTYAGGLPMPKAGKITGIIIFANTAPTGGPLTLQLKKNGANFGATQALGSGQTLVTISGLNLTYAANDVLQVSFTTVGSPAAADVTITLVCVDD